MPLQTPSPLSHFSLALSELTTAAAPSVVSVRTRHAASGFVWKPGLVVTAADTLDDAREPTVIFAGGRQATASRAGLDPTTDVALLRVDTGDAPALPLADEAPAAGALALGLGAFEGRPVAALGVVSVSGPAWRSMRGGDISHRVELSLALERRAEGGPAIDTEGRALGMTVFGPRGRVLVIPGATLSRVAAQLDAKGRVGRGYLGASLQPVRLDGGEGAGVMAMSVDPDGPAARAGLQQGDIVLSLDDTPVASPRAVMRALGPDSVGRSVRLGLRRGADQRTLDLVIGERPVG